MNLPKAVRSLSIIFHSTQIKWLDGLPAYLFTKACCVQRAVYIPAGCEAGPGHWNAAQITALLPSGEILNIALTLSSLSEMRRQTSDRPINHSINNSIRASDNWPTHSCIRHAFNKLLRSFWTLGLCPPRAYETGTLRYEAVTAPISQGGCILCKCVKWFPDV